MNDKTFRDRQILSDAQDQGPLAVIFSYLRLSGPGWLQSAITLGSGSLIGALYLGMLGGTSMLWLQLVAIVTGVIMLSAIAYVTLSTHKRPYRAINEHINPVLGVSWITATILANMIWIMPQFSLCIDSLDNNLLKPGAFDFSAVAAETDDADGEETEPTPDSESDNDPDSEKASEEEVVSLAVDVKDDQGKADAETETASAEPSQVVSKKIDFGKDQNKFLYSALIAAIAFVIVVMSYNPGFLSKLFDITLKLIVGFIVICFVMVVYWLAVDGAVNWNEVFLGFIPNFGHWSSTAPSIQGMVSGLDGSQQEFWNSAIITKQRESMIGVTATAVGLNMTFLLPYSMLARGWDKPFRGLARFDLVTGMAIPYLIVTTCIVIASAHAFHAKADPNFLSKDPAVMQQSVLFGKTVPIIEKRFQSLKTPEEFVALNKEIKDIEARRQAALDKVKGDDGKGTLPKEQAKTFDAEMAAANATKNNTLATFAISLDNSSLDVPDTERRLMPTLVKPNATQFAATLTPMLGNDTVYADKVSNLIFGFGSFAMGFSTIVILSLINSYAFAEIFGKHNNNWIRVVGALLALTFGIFWYILWAGESRTYLVILASTFGAILLPIAYLAFFLLMNSKGLLKGEKPTGGRMAVWNFLMAICVLGAVIQAVGAIQTKLGGPNAKYVLGGVAVFVLLAIVGFSARRNFNEDDEED